MRQSTPPRDEIPLVVILGPTASGKSDLAIALARKFRGEIVSADSRQVYKGLDIGTGKVTKRERQIVVHHLIDVVSIETQFTVARYKKLADSAIEYIWKSGKLPFLVGGSPLYIKAVIEGYEIPTVKPDWRLRRRLEAHPLANLVKLLKLFDPGTYTRIDKKNSRRMIRALEIIYHTGRPLVSAERKQSRYNTLILGIDMPRELLYSRIDARVDARVKKGMLREVERLLERGVSKRWLKNLGLEYRYITDYLAGIKDLHAVRQKRRAREEALERLKFAIHDFARRQLVWYRKMPSVSWVKNKKQAQQCIQMWRLNKKP